MLWSSSSYGLPIDVRCTTEHICTSDRITRVGYFYMDLCLVHDIQLCYNKSEIRAAPRAICDTAAFRTRCRSETDENPIRAAKRRFEPRGTRLPDARISKPHPRKGTETLVNSPIASSRDLFQNHIPARGRKPTAPIELMRNFGYFKTTSPQGDGNNQWNLPLSQKLLNFKTISPQGDGNTFFSETRTRLVRFQNHIPARGRKPHGRKPENNSDDFISKPHPRKGTETTSYGFASARMKPYFKTTSPQGDGTHKGRLPLIFLCFFRAIVTSATESRSILIYTGLIDDSCFQPYRSE